MSRQQGIEDPSAAQRETASTLRFEHVFKRYGSGRAAADDVSFTLSSGEIVGLLGPNGAGKTTILKLLGGMIEPDRGTIRLDLPPGSPPAGATSAIGLVLDGGRDLVDYLTPVENLSYFGALMGIAPALGARRAARLLDRFGLGAQREQQIRRLSRGKRQAVSLCAALLHEPRFLVLDEPTLGLDAAVLRTLSDTLAELRDAGYGILIATHHIEFIEPLADRTLIVGHGKILADVATATSEPAAPQHFRVRTARPLAATDDPAPGVRLIGRAANVVTLVCTAADLARQLGKFAPYGVLSLEVAASGLARRYVESFGDPEESDR